MTRRIPIAILALLLCARTAPAAGDLPIVTVTGPITIEKSCRIVIPQGTIIRSVNESAAIKIEGSDITVEFARNSILRGAAPTEAPDTLKGIGVTIRGSGVTLRGARVEGYQCGILAAGWGISGITGITSGLLIESAQISNIWRMHLRSTLAAEDGGDWLWPHRNDAREWRTNYGAAICIEGFTNATVRYCSARASQNGLILDRVRDSKIYDNDFSFLSGWGIAMWRCNQNVISRNALDFCIRGYSHGVYNRGQDSAGILFFEQCCLNTIAENSATHCGDGFFGFAGREAIGETWLDEQREKLRKQSGKQDVDDLIEVDKVSVAGCKRKGCNNNVIIKNDFSYAAAHGIELTFSFDNAIDQNRLIGNAICGIWAGYSQNTWIGLNRIEENGNTGYGLERGGINIEHGSNNTIWENAFRANVVGIHLWGGPNGNFDSRPWGMANGSASTKNSIVLNEFKDDDLAFHFRGPGDVDVTANELHNVKAEIKADPAHQVTRGRGAERSQGKLRNPEYPVVGEIQPVGARQGLAGRENIIMTEWGPWDHASPLVRPMQQSGSQHVFELRKLPSIEVTLTGAGVSKKTEPLNSNGDQRLTLTSGGSGVFPYHLKISGGGFEREQDGVLIAAKWSAVFFPWEIDPRKDLEGWRKLADGPDARKIETDSLSFKYANGGPKDLKLGPAIADSKIGSDHFGMIARTKIPLTKGKWNFKTVSDDGVRVLADGKPIIENWAWHGPTTDRGTLQLDADREVELVVEHFEIDGYAVLDLDIGPDGVN